MFKTIYVPVDNSAYSNRAIALGVELGRRLDAKLIGSHVYAAKMHDYRFKQMEYTLPEEYLQENELERQRKIHDSLITMGLELISDSYLDQMETECKHQGLPFERKMMDGKHFVEIIKDIDASAYDLTVIGAHGIGKVKDSDLGSVAVQVTRKVNRDIWVIKDYKDKERAAKDTILVAIDGSPQSFGGLMTALQLAAIFEKKVELISVYDPYLHYSVFSGIVDVLSQKAKKVFRFEEQNQLHEEIIDTGLAQIYQSHLNVAEALAESKGFEVGKTLLDGKAFQKILDHARKSEPWLLVMGRVGVHGSPGELGLGNTTENLLRLCPCDVFLNSKSHTPQIDLKAEESIRWTDEAKARMQSVPSLVRGIARTGILRMALEQGHSVVTNSLISEAMERYMPKHTGRVTEKLAEAVALDRAQSRSVSICRQCGVTSKQDDPVKCSVCGASDFEIISQEVIQKIAAGEGGIEEEAAYDGRKLKWSREARLELRSIQDAYQRRRAKARVEKTARIRRIETITLEHVQNIIKEELGSLPINIEKEKTVLETTAADTPLDSRPVVATDGEGHRFHSELSWELDALERMLRVPAGFMRERTQQRVEAAAGQQNATRVTLAMVAEGLEMGQKMMDELLRQAGGLDAVLEQMGGEKAVEAAKAHAPEGVCPFHAARRKEAESSGQGAGDEREMVLNEVGSVLFPTEKARVSSDSSD